MSQERSTVIFEDEFEFITNVDNQDVSLFGSTYVDDYAGSFGVNLKRFMIDGLPVSVGDISTDLKEKVLMDFHTKRHQDMYMSLGISMTKEEHAQVAELAAKDVKSMMDDDHATDIRVH